MSSAILYEKEITVNAIDSAYEKGKKEGTIEELENIKAEFEEIEDYDYVCGRILPAWKVYDIIENRISDLKGK